MALRKNLKLVSFGENFCSNHECYSYLLDASEGGCISQLETMRDLMFHMRTNKYPNQPDKVMLPCEYFDLMGGSGFGG